jgi:serine/threonine protein kinase
MVKRILNFYPRKDMQLGNKYLLQDFIDDGTFGYVWKALNLQKDETVALKIPKDQEKGDLALSEGKRLIGCEHPNIIRLNWMGRVDGVFVIEMEYFPGHKLSDELSDRGFKNPGTFELVYHQFLQILNGIEFMHKKRICHGDIKPQNILVADDKVKITDFGTSKFVENLFVKTVDGGGTWAYMAPEVAGSNKRYLNSDIYSLGVLLYQLLTGRTPHETAIQVLNNMPYPKPREINDSIPPAVEKVILRALERKPNNRYQNVNDLKEDFVSAFSNVNLQPFIYKEKVRLLPEIDWLEEVLDCYRNENYEKAEQVLRHEQENGLKSQDLTYHFAYTYFYQNRFYESLSKLEEIDLDKVEKIRRDAFEDNVLALKARVYLELKQYEQSKFLYEKLVKKNNENINYKYKLACVYALNNMEDRAIEILEEIQKKTPGLLHIVKKLGHAYDQKREYSKARGYYNYALKLDPNDEMIKNRMEVFGAYLKYI